MESGASLITKERERQISEEGWTAEHDDTKVGSGHLALTGACYALYVTGILTDEGAKWRAQYLKMAKEFWPWADTTWKPVPEDPIRTLVKAGALIAAEIDRMQRGKF